MTELNWKDLKRASANGAAINIVSQICKFGLLFCNQVVMARLLTPADFGLVAMVAPIMAFIVLFADLGLSQAAIQRKNITQSEKSFLFWMNVAVACTLAVIVIAISPLVGIFYHEPRVVAITVIMGATLIISGLTNQHTANFTRNMEFKKLAFLDIGSLLVGFAAGFIAALQGMDYWSLIVIHVGIYVTNLIGSWTLSKWRPSFPALPEDWKSLLRFGGNLSGFNIVNYFARNLDNILIGRFNGEVPLGIYDRAYKLLLMPLNQISQPFTRVALPLLAKTHEDPVIYRRAYLRLLEIIMLITYPGVLYAVIDHQNLILTVLGAKWTEVSRIFAILGIGAFAGTISSSTGWLFISQDRTKDMRNWGIFSSAVFILSFVAGLPWGPQGVATCYVAVGFIQGPILWWAVTRKGPVTLKDLTSMLLPYAVSLAVTGTAIYGLTSFVLPQGIWGIVAMLPLSYIIFCCGLMLTPRGRETLRNFYNHFHGYLLSPLMKKYRPKKIEMEDEPL